VLIFCEISVKRETGVNPVRSRHCEEGVCSAFLPDIRVKVTGVSWEGCRRDEDIWSQETCL